MASLYPLQEQPQEEPKHRSLDPKPTKSPKGKGSSFKHKTRSPAAAVKKSEQSLNQLLADFEGGKLNAFGETCLVLANFCLIIIKVQ